MIKLRSNTPKPFQTMSKKKKVENSIQEDKTLSLQIAATGLFGERLLTLTLPPTATIAELKEQVSELLEGQKIKLTIHYDKFRKHTETATLEKLFYKRTPDMLRFRAQVLYAERNLKMMHLSAISPVYRKVISAWLPSGKIAISTFWDLQLVSPNGKFLLKKQFKSLQEQRSLVGVKFHGVTNSAQILFLKDSEFIQITAKNVNRFVVSGLQHPIQELCYIDGTRGVASTAHQLMMIDFSQKAGTWILSHKMSNPYVLANTKFEKILVIEKQKHRLRICDFAGKQVAKAHIPKEIHGKRIKPLKDTLLVCWTDQASILVLRAQDLYEEGKFTKLYSWQPFPGIKPLKKQLVIKTDPLMAPDLICCSFNSVVSRIFLADGTLVQSIDNSSTISVNQYLGLIFSHDAKTRCSFHHLIDPARRQKLSLLLCSRRYDTDSVFYFTHFPLDLFKLICFMALLCLPPLSHPISPECIN